MAKILIIEDDQRLTEILRRGLEDQGHILSKLPHYPNIILLSGTGRNVGKTTFVCRLLNYFNDIDIVTVKVSPHWHETKQGEMILFDDRRLMLMRETNRESYKDTSRMLRCGAKEVFYLQYTDEDALMEAFYAILGFGFGNIPLIIETAVLGKYIRAAMHFRITRSDQPASDKPAPDVPFDRMITFDGHTFDFNYNEMIWNNSLYQWELIL